MPPGPTPARLLLVEDDATSRAFLVAASEALPATVDAASSVSEALAIAAARDHDLWLIDAHLPDGSGAELLSMLRARGLHAPALAHTATRDEDTIGTLRAAGFDGVVCKPLPADAWRDALRQALRGEAATSRTPPGDTTATVRPVWDDAAALAAMNGNAAHVDALRALFLAELPALAGTLSAASAAGDPHAVLATLHKLRASCGFVGAARVDAAAQALRASPASAPMMAALAQAIQETLSS
ncbi:response regulator [Luteimonas aestuarii]|uniref:Response regulator n=1 Tax=Luteimonas aestuarii TaxID=453837 RepID=A0A4R5TXX2_9GAMM|nr:response regulator [Luteimonas aestuarii]TDK26023.1 response regulator [Luteimonas aestuarii]